MERSLREVMGNDPIEGSERAPKTRSDVEHVSMRDTPPGASRKGTEHRTTRGSHAPPRSAGKRRTGEGWQEVQQERGDWRVMRSQIVLRGCWKLESPLP